MKSSLANYKHAEPNCNELIQQYWVGSLILLKKRKGENKRPKTKNPNNRN